MKCKCGVKLFNCDIVKEDIVKISKENPMATSTVGIVLISKEEVVATYYRCPKCFKVNKENE